MKPIVPVGTPIAVVAPSHAYNPEQLNAGLAIARAAGHHLVLLDDIHTPHRYFAHTDERRLATLTAALTSPDFGAVWAVRGGSGVTRLLPRLPWANIPPRPVIGFSDLTPLLDAMAARTGAVGVHGPVLHSLAATDRADQEALFALLAGAATPPLRGEVWSSGHARGPLRGGNLTLLAATCGTPFQCRAEGAILLLEDIGETPYRLDRSLQQLLGAGVFDGVAGIVLGTWDGCAAPAGSTWRLEDMLAEVLLPLGIPVIAGLPCGHGNRNQALLIGADSEIVGDQLIQA